MRLAFLLLVGLLAASPAWAQTPNLKVASWNIRDLGRSKSDGDIDSMAQLLRGFDLIAVQEVVAKDPAGAKAVARLADALDRTGSDYDYRVSDPTRSSSPYVRERYAYLWRTSTVELVRRPRLLAAFAKTIEREPYLATFAWHGKRFRIANFHARPHDQQPERELAQLRSLLTDYDDLPLLLAGDFNVVSHHTVFNPWRARGYQTALTGQRTTLRRKPPRRKHPGEIDLDDRRELDYYAHESDNILVPAHRVQVLERGIVDLVAYAGYDLHRAGQISDHAPVYVIFDDFPQLDRHR